MVNNRLLCLGVRVSVEIIKERWLCVYVLE